MAEPNDTPRRRVTFEERDRKPPLFAFDCLFSKATAEGSELRPLATGKYSAILLAVDDASVLPVAIPMAANGAVSTEKNKVSPEPVSVPSPPSGK